LKFNIRDIGPDGLQVRRSLGDSQVRELCGGAGVELGPSPATFHLDVTVTSTEASASVILVRGSMSTRFEVACSRCLGPAPIEASEEDLRLTFFPGAPRLDEQQELSDDDLDTYTYDGEEIDLEPVVREFVLLTIPMAPVCTEACKGICGGCGADLNREPCRCAARADEAPPTPWGQALQRLKKTS
jgi:uncharacterized metal-binding protein YceD (DUF177 family)